MHRFILSDSITAESKDSTEMNPAHYSSGSSDNAWLDRFLSDDSGLDDSVISSLAELRFA